MKSMRTLLSLSLFLVSLSGPALLCPAAEDATPAAPAVQPALTPYDTPMVKYGDKEFTLGYTVYYSREKLQALAGAEEEEAREEIIRNAIRTMIFEHKLADEALGSGMRDEMEFKAHNRQLENGILHDLYVYHQFTKNFKPDPEELKQQYEANKEKYFTPPQFTFRHIFFQTVDRSEQEQQEAQANAQAALALIKSGSPFEEVADRYSASERKSEVVGPYKPRKYIPADSDERPINEVIEAALLKLKPGEISEITQTKYGYEILKLETFEPEQYAPFEQVQAQMASELRAQKRKEWIDALKTRVWDQAVAEYKPEVILDATAPVETVIAKVWGEPYTRAEYLEFRDPEKIKKPGMDPEELRQRLLDDLNSNILFKMVVAKLARDLHYDKIPLYLYVSQASRVNSISSIWLQRLTAKHFEEHPITAEAKREFYDDNPQFFQGTEKAHAGEMTFAIPAHDAKVPYEVHKAQQAALSKAQKAIERLKAGEEFTAVAKEMSESKTAEQGGDLGIISVESEDETARSLARDVTALEPGKFTETPVKKGDAFHVLICYDKPARETLSFDDPKVQERAERGAKADEQKRFQQELMDKMVEESQMQILLTDFSPYYNRTISPISNEIPKEYQEETK